MENSGFGNALEMCRTAAYGIHDGANILVCSDDLAQMFGASSGSALVGREIRSLCAAALTPAAGPVRSVGVRAGGETFSIELSALAIRFGGRIASLMLVRDLSPIAMVIDDEPSVAPT